MMLSPKVQSDILYSYHSLGMKIRAISRQMGLNRKTVDRVIKRGSVANHRTFCKRGSIIDPYINSLEEMLRKDLSLSATVLFQRIRQQGYPGSYTLVRECVPGLKDKLGGRKHNEAFFTLDFPCGQAAQVDWGEFGTPFGNEVKVHCFVMTLCYSRLLYIEFTRSEKFAEFIRCHENAFSYFGHKRPQEIWYDNLPTAVSERKGALVRFNPRFYAYAGHHRFRPIACNKARGNEKGQVENGVKYVRNNFWPGRSFQDFTGLQAQAFQWRDETANLREHEITRKIPRWCFDEEEKAALLPCGEPYDTDEVLSKVVKPDYHLVYETNRYSMPWTLVGCTVTVRIDAEWIKIFYKNRLITKHSRCYRKNQPSFTVPKHEEGLIERKPKGAQAHLNCQNATLESYGPSVKKYLQCLRGSRRSLRGEVSQLLALGTVYGPDELDEAVSQVIRLGSLGVERVEQILKRKLQAQPVNPPPLSFQNEHLTQTFPHMDLSPYDQLLMQKSKKESEDE